MADHVDALTPAGVSELANFIIRPPRAHYSRHDLGNRNFTIEGTPAHREDLTIENSRSHHLHASHFRPLRTSQPPPTVVYLHGNGSCRVEATVLLPLTIPYGLSLFAFDFSGSGRSDGDYISLGVWERHDVEAVVDHLVEAGVQTIILWGHSMGAATALMYAGLCDRMPTVKALILDSPFASFDKLAHSMVSEMPLPLGLPRKLVLSVGVRAVRKIVRERAGFDVYDIDPLSALRSIPDTLPALFIHGTADAVVPISHGQLLYDSYPCPKKLWLSLPHFEHDTTRPEGAMDKAFFFMMRILSDVTSTAYLEALKSRGNVAMLSGRFEDAIFLYSKTLFALVKAMPPHISSVSHTPTNTHESGRSRDRRSTNPGNLSRRNSSIPSLVTSVKRWRNRGHYSSATSTALTDDEGDVASGRVRRAPRQSQENARRASTDVPVQWQHMKDASFEGVATVERKGEVAGRGRATGDEDLKSDASDPSGKFSRQRSWRARKMVDRIRRRMRGGGDKDGGAGGVGEGEVSVDGSRSNSVVDEDKEKSRIIAGSGAIASAVEWVGRAGDGRRPSRSSRSSSRVRLRYRMRREKNRRESGVWEDKVRGGEAAMPDREEGPDGLDLNLNDGVGMGCVTMDELSSVGLDNVRDIATWDVDEERRTLALALLGNRSLARRKAGDIQGALCDATRCLQLDSSWVRGYLRKATALREDGRVGEAKSVVTAGLLREPHHAGLMDLLQSLELCATEEEDGSASGSAKPGAEEGVATEDGVDDRTHSNVTGVFVGEG